MRREENSRFVGDSFCVLTMVLVAIGFLTLALELKRIQVDATATYNYAKTRQSVRRVRTAGVRGRILDSSHVVLAGNRLSRSIVCDPVVFQRRSWSATAEAISNAAESVAKIIGVAVPLDTDDIRRHVNQSLSMPLFVWRDIPDDVLARFCEHAISHPGFAVADTVERTYPSGRLAAHLLGYVGRDTVLPGGGDVRFSFSENELCGRSGIEYLYDGFLRGVPGEKDLVVDARGFRMCESIVTECGCGPDLVLTIDSGLQRTAEVQLSGEVGSCVAIDPDSGAVLAMASSPGFDPNDLVPILRPELYNRLSGDSHKPLLNRAVSGTYAPGSTFKPVTALAALGAGIDADGEYDCTGIFEYGGMTLRCSRRWGHGMTAMREALRDSCNGYFCNIGRETGTNALCAMARRMGLGVRTGIDCPGEHSGVVPDASWKMRTYAEKWYPGDLVQMSIGQGMLLVTPVQMACLIGAIGTGRLVTPHLKADMLPEVRKLDVPEGDLEIVREGLRMVTLDGSGEGEVRGTGWRGAQDVNAKVIGKTGTAEVGVGAMRRKNVWFVAYATSGGRSLAVAMLIENGSSGGGTAAPRVAAVLRHWFGGNSGSRGA